jgi:hypothetical protein
MQKGIIKLSLLHDGFPLQIYGVNVYNYDTFLETTNKKIIKPTCQAFKL